MLFSKELRGAERAMDGYALRFQAAAHNLANIHTPGYQKRVVDFESSLKQAISLAEDHIDPDRPMDGPLPNPAAALNDWLPRMSVVENRAQRIDGNGITLEEESAHVTRAAGKFNLLAAWVAAEYRGLKYVIDAK